MGFQSNLLPPPPPRPDVASEPSGDIIAWFLCSFPETAGMFPLLMCAEDVAMWRFPSHFFSPKFAGGEPLHVCVRACTSERERGRESRALWHFNLRLALLLINLVFTNKLMSDGPSSQHDVSSNFFLCIIFLCRVSMALLWPFFSHLPLSLSRARNVFFYLRGIMA